MEQTHMGREKTQTQFQYVLTLSHAGCSNPPITWKKELRVKKWRSNWVSIKQNIFWAVLVSPLNQVLPLFIHSLVQLYAQPTFLKLNNCSKPGYISQSKWGYFTDCLTLQLICVFLLYITYVFNHIQFFPPF